MAGASADLYAIAESGTCGIEYADIDRQKSMNRRQDQILPWGIPIIARIN